MKKLLLTVFFAVLSFYCMFAFIDTQKKMEYKTAAVLKLEEDRDVSQRHLKNRRQLFE